jgi:hypothetical protein
MPKLTNEQLANMTVAEVMDRWPQVLPLFNRYRLACGGCVMAEYCKISDVPASYEHVAMPTFLAELHLLIEDSSI